MASREDYTTSELDNDGKRSPQIEGSDGKHLIYSSNVNQDYGETYQQVGEEIGAEVKLADPILPDGMTCSDPIAGVYIEEGRRDDVVGEVLKRRHGL